MRELRGMPALAAVLLELEGCGEGELITNSTLPPIQFKTYLQHPSIPSPSTKQLKVSIHHSSPFHLQIGLSNFFHSWGGEA